MFIILCCFFIILHDKLDTHGLIYVKFAFVKINSRVKVNINIYMNYIFMFSSHSKDGNENIINIRVSFQFYDA